MVKDKIIPVMSRHNVMYTYIYVYIHTYIYIHIYIYTHFFLSFFIYLFISPFGFPLHFEGAWVPYEAEKDSYFVQQYWLDTPALVDKSVLRIIMLNA